ncbi:MAG: hypothetical protein A2234_00535 [Elusimicrobia bacterium RIFOXYA2_FULL_58_8]|nr:MAG: hypothetical protein A2234_00535 [Elusimicrobia bacterium RIFOXYA2_FULL_58_8]
MPGGAAKIMNDAEPNAPGRAQAGPGFLYGWRPFAALFCAGFLLYAHILSFELVFFDDNVLLLKNRGVLAGLAGIGRIFSSDVFMMGASMYYRPMLNISFMADTMLGGPPFFIFYFTNILLHTASAALLFLFLSRLGRGRALSFMLSLLFLFHPALTQAVAWLPGRNDSLLFIFVILSFLNFFKFLEDRAKAPFAGYLFFFLAALFTKETAAVVPFLAALYAALVFSGKIPRRAWAALAAGSLAVLAVWFFARSAAFPGTPVSGISVFSNIQENFPALVVLTGKTVFPLDPGIWLTLADASFLYGGMALALLAAAFVFSRGSKKGVLGFGLLWFFVFLVPTLVTVDSVFNGLATVYVREHRLYLPLAGFLIFFSELKWVRAMDFRDFKARAAAAFVLSSFACVSFVHSYNFSGRMFFWENAVAEAPAAALPHLKLGLTYYLAGFTGAAQRQYGAVLAINPVEPTVHYNLGLIYADRGARVLAAQEFKKELEIDPGSTPAVEGLKGLRGWRGLSSGARPPAARQAPAARR